MHADHGHVPDEYRRYLAWKVGVIVLSTVALAVFLVFSLAVGPAGLSLGEVLSSLSGMGSSPAPTPSSVASASLKPWPR